MVCTMCKLLFLAINQSILLVDAHDRHLFSREKGDSEDTLELLSPRNPDLDDERMSSTIPPDHRLTNHTIAASPHEVDSAPFMHRWTLPASSNHVEPLDPLSDVAYGIYLHHNGLAASLTSSHGQSVPAIHGHHSVHPGWDFL